ncbi:MAG: hypothetical protein HN542_00825 [Flavobacteriales bacterium]|jgi:ABC-type glycerol-3-phosphate transport system substrate-binding protein|nr:hypothetical protein [Flavobacteriales bacterium]MBT3962798.1 hypothetical protein [Flavobacteriales bacterium]MBT4705002.1 hypothetical protein [Flavobacteriales bacterium]MBT4929777.1 hypothetical protein [Flavobacteriales bacterium]MBT5133246.1 hypothetical protein [Flavobacteriales bacterium]
MKVIVILFALVVASCSGHEKQESATNGNLNTNEEVAEVTTENAYTSNETSKTNIEDTLLEKPEAVKETKSTESEESYLVITFTSKGSGIDRNAKKSVKAYLAQLQEDNSLKVEIETSNWGREGETQFCLDLETLNDDQVKACDASISEIIEQSETTFKEFLDNCPNR